MNVELATADFSFPLLPWEQSLKLARMLEMTGIDISLFAGRSHLNPDEILRSPARSAIRVVREASTEYFFRILEFTTRCNAAHLTILPGVHFDQESYEASFERCFDELHWRCEMAQKVGVALAIEPHIGSIVPTPAQTAKLLQKVPALTLSLDYSHFVAQGIADDEIEPLIPCASHFHARCARKERIQAPFRENTIDFRKIVRAMKRAQYSGFCTIEYNWIEWEHCNETDNVSENVLLRDLLREAITAAQTDVCAGRTSVV